MKRMLNDTEKLEFLKYAIQDLQDSWQAVRGRVNKESNKSVKDDLEHCQELVKTVLRGEK